MTEVTVRKLTPTEKVRLRILEGDTALLDEILDICGEEMLVENFGRFAWMIFPTTVEVTFREVWQNSGGRSSEQTAIDLALKHIAKYGHVLEQSEIECTSIRLSGSTLLVTLEAK